ncbi:hypothetical protein OIU77_028171 [Salix suchowensis]|uniref:Association with the SNF1 complex (ASC) domain-containing protein n=1 Tax=Salix suchowensis TaxID=1278906 RepID=A0ABQ9BIA2_9ROSI|nr:hypothetical protein OIU77_028171 [Salix suchowensis]
MGNANGREEGERDDGEGLENGESSSMIGSGASSMLQSVTILATNDLNHNRCDNIPPDHAPARSTSPFLFPPQVPVAPLQRPGGPLSFDQMWQNESPEVVDEGQPPEQGIPAIITWNDDGNNVDVEGSWDNFTSRKKLQRSGKDHSILMVLPPGIYHYKFIVDGEWRHIPDLPLVTDEMGCVCNLLDVHDFVPENIDNVIEFEAPPSPDSTYSQAFPAEDDFAKEPLAVPPQLHLTVLDEAASSKPQHVVLNHLYIEKGWASHSLVALGLTHRFQSKKVHSLRLSYIHKLSDSFIGTIESPLAESGFQPDTISVLCKFCILLIVVAIDMWYFLNLCPTSSSKVVLS